MKSRNLYYIEFIRILAAFLVIFNHTDVSGYLMFLQRPTGSILYWAYLPISVFCKTAVPLFFMIAGALLLRKDISLKVLWKDKIPRIFIVLVLFSLVYYIRLAIVVPGYPLNIKEFVSKLYGSDLNFSFWYLYAYLAFLITLPFLRGLAKMLDQRTFLYLLGLTLLFSDLIPAFERTVLHKALSLNGNLSIGWLTQNIVLYPLLGYYLANQVDVTQITRKQLGLLGMLGMGNIIFCAFLNFFHQCFIGPIGDIYTNSLCLLCIAIFLSVRVLFTKHIPSPVLQKLLLSIGSCTFGIYLLHLAVKDSPPVQAIWSKLLTYPLLNQMFVALLMCLLIFVIACILTWILKKIPGLKKLL